MPSSKPASPEMRCRTNSLINKPKNSLATNPPHPRPTQTIRPRHAPPLARPHPQSVGRRPAPMPLLQRHDEARPQGPPSRGNQKTPKACRRFGQESAQRVKGRGATLNQFFLRLHGLWEGVIHLPRPPPPPFDIETIEPISDPFNGALKRPTQKANS